MEKFSQQIANKKDDDDYIKLDANNGLTINLDLNSENEDFLDQDFDDNSCSDEEYVQTTLHSQTPPSSAQQKQKLVLEPPKDAIPPKKEEISPHKVMAPSHIVFTPPVIQNRRDIPIYVMTDIHMNPGPLEAAAFLTDGIVAINGDIVGAVVYNYEQNKLGSSKTHSFRRIKKGTWTDPLTAIQILGKRRSKYPIIASFGNNDLYQRNYKGSDIKDLQGWISSLRRINVIPLITYPDKSDLGAYKYYSYKNCFFFAYSTSFYSHDREKYEMEAVYSIADQIQSVCDHHTTEIHLMLHAGFAEGSNIAAGIVSQLAYFQSIHELPFDVMSIHFTYYVGHHHGSKVEKKYRVNNNYWEGKITVELFGNSKNIRCVFPNCANDCIQISPNGDKSIKGRFIQKKKH